MSTPFCTIALTSPTFSSLFPSTLLLLMCSVRSELVSTKKRLSDAQQSLAGKEAQLLNLKSAYDKMAQELQSLRAGALPKSLV